MLARFLLVLAGALAGASLPAHAQDSPESTGRPRTMAGGPDGAAVHHRSIQINGLSLFYREAGPAGAPAVVLLHGFPTSSNMFRNLIAALKDHYRVIAPDYPGFGHSAMPDRSAFRYSFASFADLADQLLTRLGVNRYALYVMDYGAPVGYRLALKHPERVTALVVQNGNAYEEGLKDFWKPIKAYWATGGQAEREALRRATQLDAVRWQYLHGVRDSSRVDPSTWLNDVALLSRPGNAEIQLDLFYDYQTNVQLYPEIQNFLRTRRPPTLIVWGRNDVIFPPDGARAYLRDLPDAELHLLDSGHFALEDQGEKIGRLMLDFLGRKLPH